MINPFKRSMVKVTVKNRSTLDGIAMLFLLAGASLVVFTKSQNMVNVGWILIVIGIVKQLLVWK